MYLVYLDVMRIYMTTHLSWVHWDPSIRQSRLTALLTTLFAAFLLAALFAIGRRAN